MGGGVENGDNMCKFFYQVIAHTSYSTHLYWTIPLVRSGSLPGFKIHIVLHLLRALDIQPFSIMTIMTATNNVLL